LHVEDLVNTCERCGEPTDGTSRINGLFRMETVITRRRARISSDEEERQRQGYTIRTAVRFSDRHEGIRTAEVVVDDQPLCRLEYGATATIWRINLGPKKRRNQNAYGYQINIEDGRWVKGTDEYEDADEEEGAISRSQTVVPYVEDRRNCLLLSPNQEMTAAQMASFQAALKMAIQADYQVEDSEMAAEPLPDFTNRRVIMLYEASEGGAGVLRQLIDEPDAIRRLAQRALEICHFSEDGQDLLHAPHASETCLSACYDCLMSYTNQIDHALLDRFIIRDLLLSLARSRVQETTQGGDRMSHFQRLSDQCESELERKWLRWILNQGMKLPTEAQASLADLPVRPDFLYHGTGTRIAVFVDGPVHEQPSAKTHDADIDRMLRARGIVSIRFSHNGEWETIAAKFPSIFGTTGQEA